MRFVFCETSFRVLSFLCNFVFRVVFAEATCDQALMASDRVVPQLVSSIVFVSCLGIFAILVLS